METAHSEFTNRFGKSPVIKGVAPGRVNLLGEHVDYNEGLVLPAAIDRAVSIEAAPRPDREVHLFALDLGEQIAFRLEELEEKVSLHGEPLPSWALYPAGVAWALQKAGFTTGGLEAVYTSDVPIGAGLSSSAAVEVGFATVWQGLSDWKMDGMALAELSREAENGYVGLHSGLMDQFASANGVAGHALFFDTRSLEWEPVLLPPGTSIIIADSGVRRSLASSAYNQRRADCERAVEILKEFMPGIHSLRDVSPTELAAYSPALPPVVRKRAEHVVKEIARVASAVTALRRNEPRSFGALMFAGHASLRDLYEVSLPELDTLVALARELPGIIGARLTGAGFGGCTVNLVESSQIEPFISGLKEGYSRATGKQAQVYVCQASDGAFSVRL